MTEYRLVVGVLGIIFDEDSEAEAKRQFDLFVKKSKTARSAEAGTSVMLFKNHEIIQEYHPPARQRTGTPADLRTLVAGLGVYRLSLI